MSGVHAEAEACAAAAGEPPIDTRASGDDEGGGGGKDGESSGGVGNVAAGAEVDGANDAAEDEVAVRARANTIDIETEVSSGGGGGGAGGDGNSKVDGSSTTGGDGEKQVFDSPNVLQPLVEAFEYVCNLDQVNAVAISEAISQIVFVLLPG